MGAPGGPKFAGQQIIGMEVYDKATGKVIYRQPSPGSPQMNANNPYQQIYAINNDVRNGKVVEDGVSAGLDID